MLLAGIKVHSFTLTPNVSDAPSNDMPLASEVAAEHDVMQFHAKLVMEPRPYVHRAACFRDWILKVTPIPCMN